MFNSYRQGDLSKFPFLLLPVSGRVLNRAYQRLVNFVNNIKDFTRLPLEYKNVFIFSLYLSRKVFGNISTESN